MNQYLCACLKLLKKQRDVGQSIIPTEIIKSERGFMLMKMFQPREVKHAKSKFKENITSAINPYKLVEEIQWIEETLWELNKRYKNYSLSGLH